MSRFDAETAVTRVADNLWRGRLDPAWNIGDNPNGGYLLSVVLAAIRQAVSHGDPVTVTAHYLRPGVADEACDVAVDVVRAGRSLSTVRASLAQHLDEDMNHTFNHELTQCGFRIGMPNQRCGGDMSEP